MIKEVNEEEKLLRTYYFQGEYFGELGMLRGEPRSATVIASNALKCVKVNLQGFGLMKSELLELFNANAEDYF